MNAFTASILAKMNLARNETTPSPTAESHGTKTYTTADGKVALCITDFGDVAVAEKVVAMLEIGVDIMKITSVIEVEMKHDGFIPIVGENQTIIEFAKHFPEYRSMFTTAMPNVLTHVGQTGDVLNASFFTQDNTLYSLSVIASPEELSPEHIASLFGGQYFRDVMDNSAVDMVKAIDSNPELVEKIKQLHAIT